MAYHPFGSSSFAWTWWITLNWVIRNQPQQHVIKLQKRFNMSAICWDFGVLELKKWWYWDFLDWLSLNRKCRYIDGCARSCYFEKINVRIKICCWWCKMIDWPYNFQTKHKKKHVLGIDVLWKLCFGFRIIDSVNKSILSRAKFNLCEDPIMEIPNADRI